MILAILSILLFLAYSGLIIFYTRLWNRIPLYADTGIQKLVKVSVIIPARNEEHTIGHLLTCLQQQSYPASHIEIIVVNDHSTDNTAAIVNNFAGVKLISLEEDAINSYKKKAIEAGVACSNGEWILATDADCLPPQTWIASIISFQEKNNSVFIAAPVYMQHNRSVLQLFQSIDFMTLQGVTGAVVHSNRMSMCNGANLAYEKKAFERVNGFSGIDDIASGDDMLLMYKITNTFPGRVHYLKSRAAIVTTAPMATWKSFWHQRIRWAGKATKYKDKRIFPVLLLVYLFNLCFPILLIAACWHFYYALLAISILLSKTLVELLFFKNVATFFGEKKLVTYFFPLQPLHIAYTILSGLLSQIGTYRWKGRSVK